MHPWDTHVLGEKTSHRGLVAHKGAGPRGEVPRWQAGAETSPPASTKDLWSCFRKKPKPEEVGGEEPALGWIWPGDGSHGELGREGKIRLRGQKAAGAAPELLGASQDGQGGNSTQMSPLLGRPTLVVPKVPSLGWMRPSRRVRPRDRAAPRGTMHPNTPPRAAAAPVGHSLGCPQQSGDGGIHHVDHLFQ